MLETTLPSLESAPVKERIASIVRVGKEQLLSGRHSSQIRELLEQRGVLVFPKMFMSKAEQLAFTQTLGTLELQGGRDVMPVSLDIEQHRGGHEHMADYLKGAFYWHIDGSASERPNLANMLTAVKLADEGGSTQFANTYAAYESLSEQMKERIEGLRVRHTVENSQRFVRPEPTLAELTGWRRYPPRVHPLVWKHQSGRKSLVLGSTAEAIEGMDARDSYLLLTELREWATQPDFVYEHEWSVGDLVIWDNSGTMHRAMPYDPDSGRLMNRTVLEGEEAIA